MSERSPHRKPATFKLGDPGVIVIDPDDASRPSRGTVHVTPEADPALLPGPGRSGDRSRATRVSLGRGVSGVRSLGLSCSGSGLASPWLIEDLFCAQRRPRLSRTGLCVSCGAGACDCDRARSARTGAAHDDRKAACARPPRCW